MTHIFEPVNVSRVNTGANAEAVGVGATKNPMKQSGEFRRGCV